MDIIGTKETIDLIELNGGENPLDNLDSFDMDELSMVLEALNMLIEPEGSETRERGKDLLRMAVIRKLLRERLTEYSKAQFIESFDKQKRIESEEGFQKECSLMPLYEEIQETHFN